MVDILSNYENPQLRKPSKIFQSLRIQRRKRRKMASKGGNGLLAAKAAAIAKDKKKPVSRSSRAGLKVLSISQRIGKDRCQLQHQRMQGPVQLTCRAVYKWEPSVKRKAKADDA